ncbi:MAG: adenine nucleotide alpha hydrolase family protein [Chloroflexi bacterium]|jgi:tRNA-5-methyluridine54 2-sulfurtransferase|nr:adenine nucleotide alpha hydrolase family protein [Chloroflexota bacterium]
MNCRKCDQKAVINMRQHKLGLCKTHFLQWLPQQTERFITKYKMFSRADKILVAVSGGKDSLALWDILNEAGYQADGLYIGLGIDGGLNYSGKSLRFSQKFAEARGLKLHTVDIQHEYGSSIPEIAERTPKGVEKPCAVCGVSKRNIMNRVARQHGYDVLATGHNLDDEAAILFSNTMLWLGNYLQRQGPVLEAAHPGLVRKVKPLFRFYERETAAYALLRGINYIYEECPFSIGAKSIYYKEILNRMEADRPGAKLIFYLSFLRARELGLFAEPQRTTSELAACPNCGQPTASPDLCAFCRMVAA